MANRFSSSGDGSWNLSISSILVAFAVLANVLVDLLLQIREAVRPFRAVTLSEYLLRADSPGIADANSVADIYVAVLAEGLALSCEYFVLGDLFAAALTLYAFQHLPSTSILMKKF